MIYAIACGQNYMTKQDMRKECPEGWIPILVMRQNGKTIIPIFDSIKIAMDFARRNLPKKWLCGHVEINRDLGELLDGKGYVYEMLKFPRKLKDLVEFDVDVVEYELVEIH